MRERSSPPHWYRFVTAVRGTASATPNLCICTGCNSDGGGRMVLGLELPDHRDMPRVLWFGGPGLHSLIDKAT
jgi:hypothetical protein